MDQSAVDDLVNKKATLIGDVMKAKIKAKNQIFVILTPQQRTQLHDMMQKLEDKIAEKYKNCHADD
jgi:periplasmic protein CpxP/Spy